MFCFVSKVTRLEIISDVVSEFFRYVPFPIPHRKLFLTVYIIKNAEKIEIFEERAE